MQTYTPGLREKNDVAALSAVFGWAASKFGGQLVTTNAAESVDIEAPLPMQSREPVFTLAEVRCILMVARHPRAPH